MIEQSESIAELAKALVKFHQELKPIPKNKTGKIPTAGGGEYSYKYADLSDIQKAIDPILSKNGLVYVQFPVGKYGLSTQVVHESGEWMRGSYEMDPATRLDKSTGQSIVTAQAEGSRISYQKRYGLGAVLGLDIDDDDDGSAASHPVPSQQATSYAESRTSVPGKPANALPQGLKANIPDGVHNVTVTEVFNGTSKASGKDYQKVTTDKGTAFNNVRPARSMEVGKAYTVTVGNGGITAATTPRDAAQVILDVPYEEEGDPSDIPF